MATRPLIALRFQRAELEAKADLGDAARSVLGANPQPATLIPALIEAGLHRDAVCALALMLPHRQVVWWGCLAVRVLPDLERRPGDLAAVAAAESWVQAPQAAEAERAGDAAAQIGLDRAPAWVATAAAWTGPSLAPRGQATVPPQPYLPGLAIRTALFLLGSEPALAGRAGLADWLTIGTTLMHGDTGMAALGALRQRLTQG